MGTRRSLPVAIGLAALLGMVSTAGPLTTRVDTPQTAQKPQAAPAVELPNRPGSLKFAVIGDFGNGSRQQTELGAQMAKLRARFPFEFVITVGDNIYGGDRPQDMQRKFELPYKALLDGGVKFYASLGNHDDRAQARYALFNMDGRTYYTFKAPAEDVRFFALETDYLNAPQVAWLEKELASSNERWKIPYFHHPLYSSGKRHGSHTDLAAVLEPLFLKAGVSVVFAGHDHFYERTKPQTGHRPLRHRVRRPAAQGRDRPPHRADGARLRHRSGVSRRRNRRRPALLQRHLAPRHGHRLGRHRAAEARIGSSASAVSRSAATGGWLAAQSASNTAAIFFAAAGLLTITPTSRRPSSSSLRRLWLPTKNAAPSRMIARTCSRRSASFRVSTAGQSLLDLADDANLDAGLLPLLERTQNHPIRHPDVVDQQLLFRAADKRRQQLARALRTDDEAIVAGVYGCRVQSALKSVAASLTRRLSRVTTPKLRLRSMSSRV